MAEQKDEKPKPPLAGLMALLFAAVSSLIIIRPHQDVATDRSREAEKIASVVRERVQSRLWQDPFEAVATHPAEREKAAGGGGA